MLHTAHHWFIMIIVIYTIYITYITYNQITSHYMHIIQGGAPRSYKLVIIPLTSLISHL